ncbi:MAG: type II toxin-antitoxin system RelE/ParE family toxin [Candidatus Omnitrophica bacterium]|nr:type II toxin-antitoxin system RelE/ParE family toxin [Candidatus Omnitrophota bacterium]
MARFKVELSSKARKFYEVCSEDFAKRLDDCFQQLERDPYYGPNIKRLKTRPQALLYRYRIGEFRVIYEVFKKEIVVLIVKIASRGDVYKGV